MLPSSVSPHTRNRPLPRHIERTKSETACSARGLQNTHGSSAFVREHRGENGSDDSLEGDLLHKLKEADHEETEEQARAQERRTLGRAYRKDGEVDRRTPKAIEARGR
jgi:hypothetical protein